MATGTVEFKVKITDDGSFKKLEISADDFNGAIKHIKSETDNLSSGLNKLSKFAIGFNQITELATKVGQSLKKIIDVGSSNELQKLNLTTLFKGNAEAAEDMFARISKYGRETVYDKEGLIEAQKTMMSFGITGEQAFATLKQIGDIAMGDGQKMQSLALAFSQATSTGKLMGQDLLQMINAGFNPLAVISEHTGESMASLKEKMSQGAISAEMLAQAFQWATEEGSLFYKGAESAGSTTEGKINQLNDTFNEFLINTFNQLQPVINAVLDFSTNVLNAIPGVLANIRTGFGNVIDTISDFSGIIIGAAAAVGALTIAINANKVSLALQELWLKVLITREQIQIALTKAWKAAQAALNMVLKANPIGLIVSAIALLVGAIATVVRNTSGWGETWQSVVNYINKSLGQMGAWFKLKWLQISDYVLSGIEEIMRAWYKLQSLWDKDAADAGLAKMESKAEERAKAIAEQKEILEGKRQDRKETTVTWAVKWDRKSKREKDEAIAPADIETGNIADEESKPKPAADNTAILSQAQFDLLKQHYDDLTKKQRAMIDKGYADLTDDEQRALKKRYDTLSKSEKRELDKQYNEAIKAAEAAQRSKENALKELYQKDGDKDAYEIGMGQVAIEGLEEQLKIAQKYGKDTTKIEQEIADAKIQQRENEYERQNNALAQSLEQRKLNLTKKLAEGTITQKQYDTQLQAAEQESYQKQLELQEQYGKNTIALQQQIAEAKIQRRNSDYDNEVDALQKNLDDTEISLKASLANQAITQDQYDRQMLAAKARFYDGMLNLTRAYGKDDRQAMRDVLDAQLNLQGFEKDQKKKPMETFAKGWDGIKGIGNSIRSIKDALTDTDNAWDALTQTVDGFLGLIQGIQAVVEVIKTITSVTKAFQVVEETATATQIAANASLSTSNTAVAATAAAASVAGIPLVGPELALTWASTIEAMLSALPKFANGGLVYGPTVGLMGEYGGASSNPEVIAPLSRLRALLGTDGPSQPSEVKFRIEGRELVGIINKQTNINRRSR